MRAQQLDQLLAGVLDVVAQSAGCLAEFARGAEQAGLEQGPDLEQLLEVLGGDRGDDSTFMRPCRLG